MKLRVSLLSLMAYLMLVFSSAVLADVIFEPDFLGSDLGWFIIIIIALLAIATLLILRKLKKKK